MIVGRDGYAINYEKERNRITILLPPTTNTATTTMIMPVERKTNLSAGDLMTILVAAKRVCQGGWGAMTDWCRQCKYSDIEGADIPCCECVSKHGEMPTGFKEKEPQEELEK